MRQSTAAPQHMRPFFYNFDGMRIRNFDKAASGRFDQAIHRMLEQLRELRMYGLTQLVFNFGQGCFCMLYGYSDIIMMMLDTSSTVLFI